MGSRAALVQAIAEGIVRFDQRAREPVAPPLPGTPHDRAPDVDHRRGCVALAVGVWWVLFIALPRWTAPKPADAAAAAGAQPSRPPRSARACFTSRRTACRLQPVDSEVPFGEGTLEQGRQLVLALLQPAPEPFVSVIPPGTTLKGVYLSPQGVAFVDLSAEASRAHPGGALDEIFTVYSIVNTLTDNLPAIVAVQTARRRPPGRHARRPRGRAPAVDEGPALDRAAGESAEPREPIRFRRPQPPDIRCAVLQPPDSGLE